jgi:sulfotransferase
MTSHGHTNCDRTKILLGPGDAGRKRIPAVMGSVLRRQEQVDSREEHRGETTLDKKIVYVTGLPRSGSTFLCQLLGTHPQVYSVGHSSPLGGILENLRHNLSDNNFLLAQLDVDFDLTYRRLVNAYRGFIKGWFAETDKPCVVDKNRAWLGMIETVHLLDPEFRMLVCLRDLVQIFGSIEAQHRRTLLLDFPDHMAPNSIYYRADTLFKNDGVIGGPLRGFENLKDISNDTIKGRIFYVSFEALVNKPKEVMKAVYDWLALPVAAFDPSDLPVKPHESDSYYRFKYRHETYSSIKPPGLHQVPERIAREIVNKYRWYYQTFYPDHYPEFKE